MDLSLLQLLANFGMGAVLAGVVIMWKRADDARYAARLAEIVERQQILEKESQAIAIKQIEIMKGLQASVEQLSNANLSRIEEQLRILHNVRKDT